MQCSHGLLAMGCPWFWDSIWYQLQPRRHIPLTSYVRGWALWYRLWEFISESHISIHLNCTQHISIATVYCMSIPNTIFMQSLVILCRRRLSQRVRDVPERSTGIGVPGTQLGENQFYFIGKPWQRQRNLDIYGFFLLRTNQFVFYWDFQSCHALL